MKNYPQKHTTSPLGHYPLEARLDAKKFYNTHAFAMVVWMLLIFLAKIHDLSETRMQIKVQENGEYYIECRNTSRQHEK